MLMLMLSEGIAGARVSLESAVSVSVPCFSRPQQLRRRREPDFSAFMSDGRVSLDGGKTNIPVKILRDTGAYDSYILGLVFFFFCSVRLWGLCSDAGNGVEC